MLAALPEPTPDNLFPPCRQADFFGHGKAHPFCAGESGFSLANAAWLADASLLAYDLEEAYLASVWGRAGFTGLHVIDGGSTRAVLAVRPEVIIVAFRGTQVYWPGRPADFGAVVADWFTDARTGLVASGSGGGGGQVHEGFKAALDQVWQPLRERVESLRLKSPGQKLWVTGHSLGGALATLAAGRWEEQVAGLYTFGSPMVGDEAFGRDFLVPCHRVVHQSDLVTEVPLYGLRMVLPTGWVRYQHVGSRHWIDGAGQIHSGEARPEERPVSMSRDVMAFLKEKLAGGSLQHHAPLYYALRLRQNLELQGMA